MNNVKKDKPKANTIDVLIYIIAMGERVGKSMTPVKAQQILYLLYRKFMSQFGQELFPYSELDFSDKGCRIKPDNPHENRTTTISPPASLSLSLSTVEKDYVDDLIREYNTFSEPVLIDMVNQQEEFLRDTIRAHIKRMVDEYGYEAVDRTLHNMYEEREKRRQVEEELEIDR